MARLIMLAQPKPEAKYVRLETFMDPDIAPGQRQAWYPWPYVEGLTIDEAMNELAFLSVPVCMAKDSKNKTGRRCALCCRGNMALRD